MRRLSELRDAELERRVLELGYRRLEVALDPEHPASRAHGNRWARELKLVELELERRRREAPTAELLDGLG